MMATPLRDHLLWTASQPRDTMRWQACDSCRWRHCPIDWPICWGRHRGCLCV